MTGDPAEGARHGALLLKTRILTWIVVLSQLVGNYFLTYGMKQVGNMVGRGPLEYILALFNPWVASGVLLLIVWLLSHMVLLSWADLSYVLPVTSIGYVLVALTGRIFLHESVSAGRWLGIFLIVGGVMLVGHTSPATVKKEEERS